jgi:cytochrome c oxidase subunit IV
MSGHISPKSTYYGIFGALMVLTAVTVGAAFTPLGAFNFPVAISIAILKATLVILFFMHVKYSSRLTKMIVAMSFFFLMILRAAPPAAATRRRRGSRRRARRVPM